MPLTTVTRRSIIDVAGVLDTPLKLVKSNKNLVKQFFWGQLPGGNFPGGHFSGKIISRGLFSGGRFSRGHFSGHLFVEVFKTR